jgi:hypothetical protein
MEQLHPDTDAQTDAPVQAPRVSHRPNPNVHSSTEQTRASKGRVQASVDVTVVPAPHLPAVHTSGVVATDHVPLRLHS